LTGTGIGLANTADRLRRLYGDDHALDFAPAPGGGLEITIRFPFAVAMAPVAVP